MSAELKVTLPDGLAREAEANGLLTAEAIEELLPAELQRRRVGKLFAAAERLAQAGAPPLTEAEVEAEIAARRAGLRLRGSRRAGRVGENCSSLKTPTTTS